MDKALYEDFLKELTRLLNKHNLDTHTNTPDFILARYLLGCYQEFRKGTRLRDQWHGKEGELQLIELNEDDEVKNGI